MQWQKMLVIDLECTCFEPDDVDKPAGWEAEKDQEIIEIGAVLIQLPERRILDMRSFLVRPDGPMGEFCAKLTSLTFEDVKDKSQLAGALNDMRVWCKEFKFDLRQNPWASWGDYDRVQFFRECARKGIEYPFARAHYNLKGLFSIMQARKKGFSVRNALDILKMPFEGRPHRGVDDAKNIAEIWLRLLGQRPEVFG